MTVILVPFYEAKLPQLKRHIDFFETKGYQVILVHLTFHIDWWKLVRFGSMRNLWVWEIDQVFQRCSGPKLIFSFSNPTSATLEVLARYQCHEVVGLVCDSGPGIHFFHSVVKLLYHYRGIKNPILLYPLAVILFFIWGPSWDRKTKRAAKQLPPEFPVLTIEGGEDPLISPDQIEPIFQGNKRIKWIKLLLPGAKHLNGMKDFTDLYLEKINEFLRLCSRS